MANEQNLRPNKKGELSREKAKELGSKGGIASGIARRNKATLRKALNDMLSQPAKNWSKDKAQYTAKILGCNVEEVSNRDTVMASLLRKALKGEIASIRELFDRIEGKAPQAIVNTNASTKPEELNEAEKAILERVNIDV